MARDEARSLLVITLSNIGDVILTTPVLSSLRQLFSSAHLTVVVGPKAVGLLEGSRQIDRLLVYDKEAGWSHKLRLLRELRERFYDCVVDLRNSAFPYLVRADRRSPIFRFFQSIPARERHLEVLKMMGLSVSKTNAFDFFSKTDEDSFQTKLKARAGDLIPEGFVVAPGAGSEEKRWPIQNFSDVVSQLLKISSVPVFVVGDAKEGKLGEELSRVNPKQVINLAGSIGLRELAVLVSRAKLLLTNDSATMHLGYELGRPVVAVFGPTMAERYGRESPIWRIIRASEPSDLKTASSETVFRACKELLNGTVAN